MDRLRQPAPDSAQADYRCAHLLNGRSFPGCFRPSSLTSDGTVNHSSRLEQATGRPSAKPRKQWLQSFLRDQARISNVTEERSRLDAAASFRLERRGHLIADVNGGYFRMLAREGGLGTPLESGLARPIEQRRAWNLHRSIAFIFFCAIEDRNPDTVLYFRSLQTEDRHRAHRALVKPVEHVFR